MRSKSASYRIKVTNPECGPARVRKSSTRGGSAARRANAVAPSSELLPHFPYNETIMKSYFTLFTIYLIATGTALGAGSKTGGAALKSEQGTQPVQVYNQGIQLMHAKKFAEAQVKFEQALARIQTSPKPITISAILCESRVPKTTRRLSNIIIKPFNSNRILRKRTNIVVSFSSRWAGKLTQKKISRR